MRSKASINGLAWLLVIAGGCYSLTESNPSGPSHDTPSADDDDADGGPPATTATPTPPPNSAVDDTDAGSSGGGGGGPGIGFIMDPDGGGVSYECSLFDQDCDPGMKCTVWANDGGAMFNATKCVAIDPDAVASGEPCVREGGFFSGEDNCDGGAFCWDMDPETGDGLCVDFCGGSENDPTCDDPLEFCTGGKEFLVCLPRCDPVENDCPAGCGCYPIDDTSFQCIPDASGEEGALGDPCEYINSCDSGSACVATEAAGCSVHAAGCCMPFCSVGSVERTCPQGTSCVPWFDEDAQNPPGTEDVGICFFAE